MDNLPVEYKDGVFERVKGFFRKLFGKEIIEIEETSFLYNEGQMPEKNSLEKFKVDVSKVNVQRADGYDRIKADVQRQRIELRDNEEEKQKRKQLLEEIKNSNVDLTKWPKEKLQRLEMFYEEEIKKIDLELEELEERV